MKPLRLLSLLAVLLLTVLAVAAPAAAQDNSVHVLYFYAEDCSHCQVVQADVLAPLEAQYGDALKIHRFEIGAAENYEGLVLTELHFKVASAQRAIPTLVIGQTVLIGEEPIREQLPGLVKNGVEQGGIAWPQIAGLEKLQESSGAPKATAAPALPSVSGPALPGAATATPAAGSVVCAENGTSGCDAGDTIWMAYFYQVGCEVCSIAHSDINYLRQKYPNVVVVEFNIYDEAALADWMGSRLGRGNVYSPAVFVGADALIGGDEINPQSLEAVAQKYAESGAGRTWDAFDPNTATLAARFRSLGPLTVLFAGLVDGLNPCAFATLIFFVSYLAISGRKGTQILLVGAAFTLGVFIAYLAVGLGFYKVLETLGALLETISRWVYAVTALLCAVLAVFSFRDYLKARRGEIGEMSMNLPHGLRMRINQVIRENRAVRAYAAGAFITGLVVSFLELACTGQIYLPTIIFVSSIPELRAQAIVYLLLYNLMFIVPLVVVFILAYYGTTSRDLTAFLQRRAAAVKLGMTVLFVSLAVWLGISLI